MTLRLNGSTSGYTEIDAPAVAGNNTLILPSGGELVAATNGNINIASINSGPLAGSRNRVINGDMRIDQRNAGASVTPTNSQYLVDRWQASLTQASKYTVQQNAGSVTPPVGFRNYLGFTSSSAYSVLAGDIFGFGQIIEGFNASDFGWGTASAQAVTLSFWVRSSLTGAFGGAIKNDGDTRNYPFSFAISAANTWEYKTVTITGDTSGTWGTTNGAGINIRFSLGCGSTYSGTAGAWTGTNVWQPTGSTSVVGTNGATFYLTGVQLEPGSTASPFERRSYGQELALCQRYYEKSYNTDVVPGTVTDLGCWVSVALNTGDYYDFGKATMKVTKRANPSITPYSSFTGALGKVNQQNSTDLNAFVSAVGMNNMRFNTSGATANNFHTIQWTASAEL